MFLILIFFITLVGTDTTAGQDCRVRGQYCIDDAVCCGGCCWDNTCTNTYGPCYLRENPCRSHYCSPGTDCYLYKPACEGCEAVPACREWIQ